MASIRHSLWPSGVSSSGSGTDSGAVGAGASKTGTAGLSDDDLSKKLQARWNARIYKDWATSDSIRAELNDLGIIINDRTQSWKCHVSGRAGSTKPTYLMNATAASTTTVESLLITRNLFPAVI